MTSENLFLRGDLTHKPNLLSKLAGYPSVCASCDRLHCLKRFFTAKWPQHRCGERTLGAKDGP
jgi:hypothetical protein